MEYTSGSVQDYYALMKPRVMSLVIFTSLVGLIFSPSNIHPFLAVISGPYSDFFGLYSEKKTSICRPQQYERLFLKHQHSAVLF